MNKGNQFYDFCYIFKIYMFHHTMSSFNVLEQSYIFNKCLKKQDRYNINVKCTLIDNWTQIPIFFISFLFDENIWKCRFVNNRLNIATLLNFKWNWIIFKFLIPKCSTRRTFKSVMVLPMNIFGQEPELSWYTLNIWFVLR